jgi:hypothetical protein
MKIRPEYFVRKTARLGLGATKRSQGGMATVVFIALLAIMLILITAESRALFQLHREVKFLEKQQIKRLNNSTTNAVVTVNSESK